MGTQGTPPAADTITAVHGFLSSHLRAAYHTPPLELDTRAAIAVMRQRVCTMKCDPAGISVEDYAVILNAFFDEGNVLPLLGSGSVSFRLCCNRQSAAGSGVGVVGGEFQHGDSGFVLTVSEVEPSPSSFADLALFAEHRGRQAPGTRQPRRHPGTEAQYDLYKAWCLQQGVDNHAYVVKYTPWDGRAFCLTPCLVPYHTEAGVSHWIFWPGFGSTTSANGPKVSTKRSKHGSADELDVLSRSCFPAAGPTTHAENPQGEHGRTLGSPLRSRVNNSKKKQLDAIWAMHACIALCTGLLALVRPALFEVFMSFGGVRYVYWMFTRVHMSEWRVIAHAHGISMHTYRSS